MLRRQARLRREFIYKKSIEVREADIQEKKKMLKVAMAESTKIPQQLKDDALKINEALDWDDEGGEGARRAEDDEYYYAGVEDPKVVVTTSRNPGARLKQFVKELRFLFPNAQRINRGTYLFHDLVQACLSNNVTDIVVVSETRGVPDGVIVSHLPFGPTAHFTLYNVLMRHDMPDVGKMPQEFPQLIFDGLNTRLGKRVKNILKYLFPVPREESKRVCSFIEKDDIVRFRQHTFKYKDKELETKEHGPRFDMRLYKIWRGPLNESDTAEVEYVLRPYLNTARKRKFLSE